MGVAHLVLAQPTLAVLGDQRPSRQTVVDLGAPAAHRTRSAPTDIDIACQASHVDRDRTAAASRGVRPGIPIGRPRTDHTVNCEPRRDRPRDYGDNIPGDDELGLIGDVSAGRRVIELGISDNGNAIALARLGAKAISVDPDPDRIGELRLAATDAEVWVECHEGDLGDLGFAPSGTIDVVLSVHTLDVVDDLGRILRQVHRVLKPGAPFVLVLDHPFAAVGIERATARSGATATASAPIGELLAALDRSNFRVEVFHELGVSGESAVPDHARHQGAQAGLLTRAPAARSARNAPT